MDIWADTLEYATWTVRADVDLSSATAEVELADTWHSLTWTGAATQSGSTWTRIGRLLVAGADAVGGLAITASAQPLVRITSGGEVVVRRSSTKLEVKA